MNQMEGDLEIEKEGMAVFHNVQIVHVQIGHVVDSEREKVNVICVVDVY